MSMLDERRHDHQVALDRARLLLDTLTTLERLPPMLAEIGEQEQEVATGPEIRRILRDGLGLD